MRLARARWLPWGLITAGLLVLSWLGIAADPEEVITLTVTLNDVLSLSLDATQVTPVTLSTADLAGALGDPSKIYRSLGTFQAQILALSDFWVGVCHQASSSLPGAPTFDFAPLILTDADGVLISGGTPAGTIDRLPECSVSELDILAFAPFFLGANNADTAGETFKFGLMLDLSALGDRIAGEVLSFQVFFRVHDPTL